MPPLEHSLQAPSRVRSADQPPQPAQRKLIVHTILQPARFRALGLKFVRVLPAAKRPGHHHVAKHLARFARRVLRDPMLRKWSNGNAQRGPRTRLLDPACPGNHAHALPRRCQPLQCIRFRMKKINGIGGRRHAATKLKLFTHIRARKSGLILPRAIWATPNEELDTAFTLTF
jgi:hypothetical protein